MKVFWVLVIGLSLGKSEGKEFFFVKFVIEGFEVIMMRFGYFFVLGRRGIFIFLGIVWLN